MRSGSRQESLQKGSIIAIPAEKRFHADLPRAPALPGTPEWHSPRGWSWYRKYLRLNQPAVLRPGCSNIGSAECIRHSEELELYTEPVCTPRASPLRMVRPVRYFPELLVFLNLKPTQIRKQPILSTNFKIGLERTRRRSHYVHTPGESRICVGPLSRTRHPSFPLSGAMPIVTTRRCIAGPVLRTVFWLWGTTTGRLQAPAERGGRTGSVWIPLWNNFDQLSPFCLNRSG